MGTKVPGLPPVSFHPTRLTFAAEDAAGRWAWCAERLTHQRTNAPTHAGPSCQGAWPGCQGAWPLTTSPAIGRAPAGKPLKPRHHRLVPAQSPGRRRHPRPRPPAAVGKRWAYPPRLWPLGLPPTGVIAPAGGRGGSVGLHTPKPELLPRL